MAVSMPTVISSVRSHLDKEGWKYNFFEEDSAFHLGFSLSETKLGKVDIYIFIKPTSGNKTACWAVSAYGVPGVKADEGCMAQMCEYLTRANYGMTLGNFELDHREGGIRFKVSFNCKDSLPGEDAISDLIGLPIWAFNRYGNGILAVSMGLQTPKEACESAEK